MWIRPFKDKFPITSPYGNRASPITGATEFHRGVDVGTPMRTPIYMMFDGFLDIYRDSSDALYCVMIDNNNDRVDIIHVDEIINPRRKVKQGEVVGYTGNSGKFTTGPHSHIEYRKDWQNDKVYRDPTFIFNLPFNAMNDKGLEVFTDPKSKIYRKDLVESKIDNVEKFNHWWNTSGIVETTKLLIGLDRFDVLDLVWSNQLNLLDWIVYNVNIDYKDNENIWTLQSKEQKLSVELKEALNNVEIAEDTIKDYRKEIEVLQKGIRALKVEIDRLKYRNLIRILINVIKKWYEKRNK